MELYSYEEDGLYWLELWSGQTCTLRRDYRTMTERKLATENIYKALKKLGGKVGWVPFERRQRQPGRKCLINSNRGSEP